VGVVGNCSIVIGELEKLLQKYSDMSMIRKGQWVLSGKDEADKLRFSLEAHKQTLDIVLEMATMSLVMETKNDTAVIREDTDILKQDTSRILEEIERLQDVILQRGEGEFVIDFNFTLRRYLERLSSCAESSRGSQASPFSSASLLLWPVFVFGHPLTRTAYPLHWRYLVHPLNLVGTYPNFSAGNLIGDHPTKI
jgi:hypothetical protein